MKAYLLNAVIKKVRQKPTKLEMYKYVVVTTTQILQSRY